MMKQKIAVSQVYSDMKAAMTPTMVSPDAPHIIMTESLYFFLFSTHIPNTADPMSPPIMNIAPNTDAASYHTCQYCLSTYWIKSISFAYLTNHCSQSIEYSLYTSKYHHQHQNVFIPKQSLNARFKGILLNCSCGTWWCRRLFFEEYDYWYCWYCSNDSLSDQWLEDMVFNDINWNCIGIFRCNEQWRYNKTSSCS